MVVWDGVHGVSVGNGGKSSEKGSKTCLKVSSASPSESTDLSRLKESISTVSCSLSELSAPSVTEITSGLSSATVAWPPHPPKTAEVISGPELPTSEGPPPPHPRFPSVEPVPRAQACRRPCPLPDRHHPIVHALTHHKQNM